LRRSETLWKEFNWFTVLALSLAATWILFVTPSLFPEAKFPWTVVAEAVASKEPGNAEAQFRLGLKYSHGESVRQDHVEAAKWYRKAAEQGHAGAQNSLGVLYDTGQGVPQNHLEAAKWFARAAEQGEDYALNNLGIMYHNGHGVPQDFVEAYKWYCLAAAKGNTNALSNRDNLMRWLTSTQIAEGQRRACGGVRESAIR